MKTLLQINAVVNYGSTGRIVEEIGESAINNNWDSYIAFGRYDRPSKSSLIKIGTEWDIKFHGLKTRLFDKHGFGSTNASVKLIKVINRIKPDLIHLHNLHGYYLNIKVLFNYLAFLNIPVIWTIHDCWPLTGHCVHFDFIGCNKWKTQCYKCPQTTTYPRSIFIDSSRTNYQVKRTLFTSLKNLTIVAVSSWLGNIVGQSYLSKYQIQVINNGIDLDIFSPQFKSNEVREKYGIGTQFMLMGVATSWSHQKGLKDYIKLSEALTNEFQIILIGLSTTQLENLPKSIIGIPRTENISELTKLYSAADIILNLSAEETFGLTTVEGFACGTPGIVYNCTASPELITPETGFIVEKGDMQGLINAIQTIKDRGKSSYSSACRDRAEKLYNKKDRYMDYLNLYDKILYQNPNIQDFKN